MIRFVIVYFFYKLITTASDGEGDSGERVGCVCVGCGAETEGWRGEGRMELGSGGLKGPRNLFVWVHNKF